MYKNSLKSSIYINFGHTGSKDCVGPTGNLEGEQLPDRPEPAQIARDRSLKKTNNNYKTRRASDVKKKSPIT